MNIQKKRRFILIAQVAVVIVASMGIYFYTNNQISPTKAYIYTRDVEAYSTISDKDIKEISVPSKAVNNSFAKTSEDIVGKKIDRKAKSGEYVYMSNLKTSEDKKDPLEGENSGKYRIVTLSLKDIGDSTISQLEKDSSVDLIFVGKGQNKNSDTDQNFVYSKTFMQDILVKDLVKEDKGNAKEGQNQGAVIGVKLAVTLAQAEEIEARVSVGQIKLVQRFNVSKPYDTSGYVVGDYNKVFSGKASAETGRTDVLEDSAEVYQEDNTGINNQTNVDFSQIDLKDTTVNK